MFKSYTSAMMGKKTLDLLVPETFYKGTKKFLRKVPEVESLLQRFSLVRPQLMDQQPTGVFRQRM